MAVFAVVTEVELLPFGLARKRYLSQCETAAFPLAVTMLRQASPVCLLLERDARAEHLVERFVAAAAEDDHSAMNEAVLKAAAMVGPETAAFFTAEPMDEIWDRLEFFREFWIEVRRPGVILPSW